MLPVHLLPQCLKITASTVWQVGTTMQYWGCFYPDFSFGFRIVPPHNIFTKSTLCHGSSFSLYFVFLAQRINHKVFTFWVFTKGCSIFSGRVALELLSEIIILVLKHWLIISLFLFAVFPLLKRNVHFLIFFFTFISLIKLEMYTNLKFFEKRTKDKTFLETVLCIQTKISKEALIVP